MSRIVPDVQLAQKRLFDLIKKRHPKEWRDDIYTMLDIAQPSLYKKAKGQTILTFDEAYLLAKEYGTYIDAVMGGQSYDHQFK